MKRRGAALLIVAAAVAGGLVAHTALDPDRRLRAMSETELRAWTARRPGDARGRLYLALARGRAGDPADAERELAAALALDPALSAARWRLARVRAARGDEDGALALLESGLTRDPGDARLHAEIGRIQEDRGAPRLAATAWERAATAAPREAEYWHRLGRSRMALHEDAAALVAYRRAAALAPSFATYQSALGGALRRLRRYDEAERCFRDALKREAASADARLGLARVLWERDGATPEAAAELRRAVALQPTNPVPRYTLGSLYEQQGKPEAAVAEYAAVLKQLLAAPPPPSDPAGDEAWLARLEGPYFRLALTLERLGRRGDAERHRAAFQRVSNLRHRLRRLRVRLENRPGDAALRAELARLRSSAGGRPGAL